MCARTEKLVSNSIPTISIDFHFFFGFDCDSASAFYVFLNPAPPRTWSLLLYKEKLDDAWLL